MTKPQKEGVFIVSLATALLLMAAALCDWRYGVADAYFCFNGLQLSCSQLEQTIADAFSTCYYDGIRRIFEFCVDLRHILFVLMPFLLYGFLRAFGIVRRLFRIEERLFGFIE